MCNKIYLTNQILNGRVNLPKNLIMLNGLKLNHRLKLTNVNHIKNKNFQEN